MLNLSQIPKCVINLLFIMTLALSGRFAPVLPLGQPVAVGVASYSFRVQRETPHLEQFCASLPCMQDEGQAVSSEAEVMAIVHSVTNLLLDSPYSKGQPTATFEPNAANE
jgi:hypothetical protein